MNVEELAQKIQDELLLSGKKRMSFKGSELASYDPWELVKAGLLPVFVDDEKENVVSFGAYLLYWHQAQSLMFSQLALGWSKEELIFYWRKLPDSESNYTQTELKAFKLKKPAQLLDLNDPNLDWLYASIAERHTEAKKDVNSLPLLLYAPDLVYKSKRPKTDMDMFRTPNSIVASKAELDNGRYKEWSVIPVTRYAYGMSRGAYYEVETTQKFCGTFYYIEPESSTYLAYRNPLIARTKTNAFLELLKMLNIPKLNHDSFFEQLRKAKTLAERRRLEDEQTYSVHKDMFDNPDELSYKWAMADPSFPPDLCMTPQELIERFPSFVRKEKLNIELAHQLAPIKRYMGQFIGLYASEDDLDQDICKLASQAGYDVIILTHMVGSHKVVSEVLDVRDRAVSFDNLIFRT